MDHKYFIALIVCSAQIDSKIDPDLIIDGCKNTERKI